MLIQRLWAQENLTREELEQLGQGGGDSKLFSAPLFIREQLLFPYADGFDFVRRIYQSSGGYAGVDEVFATRPTRPSRSCIPRSTARANSPSR